jgi:hypothetical protein
MYSQPHRSSCRCFNISRIATRRQRRAGGRRGGKGVVGDREGEGEPVVSGLGCGVGAEVVGAGVRARAGASVVGVDRFIGETVAVAFVGAKVVGDAVGLSVLGGIVGRRVAFSVGGRVGVAVKSMGHSCTAGCACISAAYLPNLSHLKCISVRPLPSADFGCAEWQHMRARQHNASTKRRRHVTHAR